MVHKHRWRMHSVSESLNVRIVERCRCGERRERAPKYFESLALDAKHKNRDRAVEEVFVAKQDFVRLFKNEDRTWKYDGYELMELVEKWASRHDGVHVLSCDDGSHASSSMCIIENQTSDHWMGLTVYVIPQHYAPSEYFLYPEHHDPMLKVLKQLKRKRRWVELRQVIKETRHSLKFRIARHLF